MIRGIYMHIVGPKMHSNQILIRGGVDILEAVDYAQRYLDNTMGEKQRNQMYANKQEISGDLKRLLKISGSEAGY